MSLLKLAVCNNSTSHPGKNARVNFSMSFSDAALEFNIINLTHKA